MSSGFTTLYIDLLIFSTAQPHTYSPFSRMNSASANSGRHFLKASMSSLSLWTRLMSTCISVVSYCCLSP